MIHTAIDASSCEGDRYKFLVAAIIQQGVNDMCYFRGDTRLGESQKLVKQQARHWIMCGDDPRGQRPWSFEWCCLMADRNPKRCRNAIRRRLGIKVEL